MDAKNITDIELVERCLKGDTGCFEQLVSRYQGPLIRFLRMRCELADQVDDIFQETFVSAYRYLKSYNQKYAFSTWLFNIAINRIKKNIKSQLNADSIDEEEMVLTYNDNQLDQVDLWVIAKEHLSSEQVELLWFTLVQGYSGKEVAQILDRSLPWVKVNLLRSKQLLREILERAGLNGILQSS